MSICGKPASLLHLKEKEREALEHHVQEYRTFGNIGVGELPHGAADLEMPQEVGWSSRWALGSIRFCFTRSSFGIWETHGVLTVYAPSEKHWLGGYMVCGLYSPKWTPSVVVCVSFRSGSILVGDLTLQNSKHQSLESQCCPQGWSSNTSYCLLAYAVWCEVSVTCAQIGMAMVPPDTEMCEFIE